MKKIRSFFPVLLAALLVLIPGGRALAQSAALSVYDAEHYETAAARVLDKAGIWSEKEEAEFADTIAGIAEKYQTDIVLLSVYILHDASLGDRTYGSITEFADDFYDMNGYGYGSDHTGLILVVSMESGNRQYHFSTTGREYEAYSRNDISYVENEVQPFLTGGDYDGAARRFLELAAEHWEKGHFETETRASGMDPGDLLWGFALALIVAWAITSNMKRRMRPVAAATHARNYAVRGSYELKNYSEVFIGSSITRTPRQQNKNGGGGFGGGHIGSSGTAHGGGGGRF